MILLVPDRAGAKPPVESGYVDFPILPSVGPLQRFLRRPAVEEERPKVIVGPGGWHPDSPSRRDEVESYHQGGRLLHFGGRCPSLLPFGYSPAIFN